MSSEQYINLSGLIILDTSTLMKKHFQVFIEKHKDWLVLNNKKFFVHRAVYTELARHLKSGNPELIEAAMRAVNLMVENSDIFSVDRVELSDEEIDETFADPILLAELTLHKSDCIQLFIVNDKDLGKDAFELNKQLSCRGHRIFVCFINPLGELQCSDCALLANDKKREDAAGTMEAVHQEVCMESVREEESSSDEPEMIKVETTSSQEPWKFDLKSGAITSLTLVVAYVICKGGAAIIRNIKMR